jgi:Ger(x)C family germination protein
MITIRFSIILLPLFLLVGCQLEPPVENQTIVLMIGMDMENDQLTIFEASPVFSDTATKKVDVTKVTAMTLRNSRNLLESSSIGLVTASKNQVLLLGKELLNQENWFTKLDTLYRDPRISTTSRVAMVDGPVSDIFFNEPPDKPRLSFFIRQLVDHNNERGITVLTTLRDLHRQMFDKGITPSVTEIKFEDEIKIMGASLLDKNGKYVDSLDLVETSYLLALQNKLKKEVTFPALPISAQDSNTPNENLLSIFSRNVKTKIKTSFKEGNFHFDIKMTVPFKVTERFFPWSEKKLDKLEQTVNDAIKQKVDNLIKKFQENKIDPIGLGVYARAYQYDHFKKVEDNWGEAFSKATININVQSNLITQGSMK